MQTETGEARALLQLALPLLVFVDVVSPGRALVLADGGAWGGNVIRDGRTFYVETDDEQVIGRARTYREAGFKLAAHYGHARDGVSVVLEDEHRKHSR